MVKIPHYVEVLFAEAHIDEEGSTSFSTLIHLSSNIISLAKGLSHVVDFVAMCASWSLHHQNTAYLNIGGF